MSGPIGTISAIRRAIASGLDPTAPTRSSTAGARERADLGAFLAVAEDVTHSTAVGALAGVPFAAKDNIDTADLPTTAGTGALTGSVPLEDAQVVTMLRQAGARLVGKTNLDELGYGITSNNGVFGPVRNPHDPGRSAGGSSGGSAVAVATGIVPIALGTDTGGSVRIPASHCGVVGFRPTAGRWPARGTVPISTTRDTVGVLARTVSDVAIVDRIVAPAAPPPRGVGNGIAGVRLGVPGEGYYENLDPQVSARTQTALEVLAAAGAQLIEVCVKDGQALAERCGVPIVLFETVRGLPGYLAALREPYAKLTLRDVVDGTGSPDVRAILEGALANPICEDAYRDCLRVRQRLQAALSECFVANDISALVYPTTPMVPPPLGEDKVTEHNGRQVDVFATTIQNTAPGAVAGTPSISLPNGSTHGGLPTGLSLEAATGEDHALLDLAKRVEAVLGSKCG